VSTPEQKPGRIRQIRTAYTLTRQADPRIGWVLLACLVLPILAGVGFGLLIGGPVLWGLFGFGIGLLLATFVFGRRAEKAALSQIEGKPGAAAAVLGTLRRGWTVTPAVAANRQYDVVHRVVGRPGVVLIAEGSPGRVGNLLRSESKRTARVIGEVPIHEIVVGDGEGQVTLRKLNRAVIKLPKALRPGQVTDVNQRLKAMSSMQQPVAMPKGPLPKGARVPRPPRG
jgi:hypothetical protein